MSSSNILRTINISLLTIVLTACNGGIGGTGGKEVTPQVISVGTVTALGSATVNGITFDTSSAEITIDESSAFEADLKQGMVVEIRGSIDSETTGTAETVVAEDVIKGMVTDVQFGNLDQIEIMKQSVEVDASTILVVLGVPDPTLDDFTNGDLVEVSGFVKGNGVILATRIEERASLVNFKLKGFIENTNSPDYLFKISDQAINYGAAVMIDLPDEIPADGMLVEVKAPTTLGVDGELLATRIKLESIRNSEGFEVELEGYITATGPPGTFYIGSQQVQTNGSTIFRGGLAADIRFGIEVEAEGQIVGGILIADEVEFEPNTEVEADTTAVDAMAGTVTLVVGGLVIITNADTEISTLAGTGNSLADLNPLGGSHLQIYGSYDVGSGEIIATQIEEKALPNTNVVLRGSVTGKTLTTIEIMGVTVTPDGTAEYRDEDGLSIVDLNTFLGQVTVGTTIVKAESSANAPIVWDKLSLQY